MGYAATHGRKCAIVIPSTLAQGATHTNFPVCFTVANLPSEMFDADGSYPAKSDGSDVRFSSDSAGDTPMNVEVERFGIDNNPANGFAEIWARIPSFSYSVDTTVYVWYNDPDATAVAADDADEGSEGVWDANFKGVWHLQTSSGGVTPDSTANGNDGTLQGSITIGGSAGLIGNSTTFDGSDDHIDIASALVSAAPATLTAWLKATAATAKRTAICINDSGTTGDLMRLCENDSPDVFMAQQYDGSSSIEKDGTTALTETATWHKADAVFANSSTSEIFVNGASEGSASGSVTLDTMDHTCIGALHWSGGNIQYWLGDMDEVRISSVARSDEWLAAEYAVINSIASITAGTPGSPSAGTTKPWYYYAQM